jgi:hypothetical protein
MKVLSFRLTDAKRTEQRETMETPLTKCRACERELSTRAEKCPHCGEPAAVPETPGKRFALIALMAVAGALVIILIFAVAFASAR